MSTRPARESTAYLQKVVECLEAERAPEKSIKAVKKRLKKLAKRKSTN